MFHRKRIGIRLLPLCAERAPPGSAMKRHLYSRSSLDMHLRLQALGTSCFPSMESQSRGSPDPVDADTFQFRGGRTER